MMDLNEDLIKSEFFDLVKGEGNPLTPVGFIDSIDYNNNTSLTSKSFLDEMLLQDQLSDGTIQTIQAQSNLEFLGTLHWSDQPTNHQWTPDGEVTTLTNLLDPLFVSFDVEHDSNNKLDSYLLSTSSPSVISSDLITTTFDSQQSSPESELLSWQTAQIKAELSDDSLLRTALQSQSHSINNKLIPTTVLAKETSSDQNSQMTELRKVLSFPPLRNDNSPTPSDMNLNLGGLNPSQVIISDVTLSSSQPYYELKDFIGRDSVFEPEVIIPTNVEELILTRIDTSYKKMGEISERKINSTTTSNATLSAKWTYTTTNPDGTTKGRKRSKKSTNNNSGSGSTNAKISGISIGKDTNSKESSNNKDKGSIGSPSSPSDGSSNSNSASSLSRKERSLHYCNICCKGFKDKYSVNVHIRTHTGEKPFHCSMCGKAFRQKAHLAKHYQTHAAKANGTHPKSNMNKRIINNNSSNHNNNSNSNSNCSSSSNNNNVIIVSVNN